ncbi:FAD-dependent oxidoreductase [Embleya sp. NBC_00896]|uniref:FAD-dependent oxidoreductase n=1 Tax=Embleya sp. NBC_00896 TaxID=2975961 RepID=UPI00386417BD|nr:lysine N(6)-hydroxylase/L-ornithine N(5)-oxygenase family protein [Embleya sp. NBC_00896]
MTVAIVGAGPYGLSLAAHLRQLGVTTRVFGEPMESWRRNMPAGMLLKSRPDASSISAPRPGFTLAAFQRERGDAVLTGDQPVPRETFLEYGRWFADRLVPDVERTRITDIRPEGHGFVLAREDGADLVVDSVVLATGLAAHRYIPPVLERLGGDLVSHSAEHADLAELGADRDVVVIGSGQSALESAALLHEGGAARVRVFGRADRVRFAAAPTVGRARRLTPDSPLGAGWSVAAAARGPAAFRLLPACVRVDLARRILGPSAAWWLRDRLDGRVAVRDAQTITRAHREGDGRVRMLVRDGHGYQREVRTDHVLAATGYRVDLGALGFLGADVRGRIATVGGLPGLDASFGTTVPGLYVTGPPAAATFGPVVRFVHGTAFASRRLAAVLAVRFQG